MSTLPALRPTHSARSRTVFAGWSTATLAAAILILVIGAALRFSRLGYLNFRNDESFTLLDARQSWRAVMGFDGFYDYHPPLSFVLAKAAAIVVPEVVASRAVAATAGVLALLVFFLLVRTVADTRAALAGSVLLAVSPAHIEFSRIGRMYAPVTLAILLSYLAMARYRQDARRRWAVLYGASLACAMYFDYSALYALVPQVFALAILVWEMRSRAVWLIVGGLGAVVAFAPWLTQVRLTVEMANDYSQRQTYLEASREAVWRVVPWILGLTGGGAGRRADWPNFWYRFPEWRGAMLLMLAPIAIAGTYALRRNLFGLAVALCMVIGTPIACATISQISPGFTQRTILTSPIGWCMLAGCALANVPMPRPMRALALWSSLFLVLASVNALPATYSNKGRVLRVNAASRTMGELTPMNRPVITFSVGGMDTDLIEAFAGDRVSGLPIYTFYDGQAERSLGMMPWIDARPNRIDVKNGDLTRYFDPTLPGHDAFWFFTHRSSRDFHNAFVKLGYDRRLRLDFNRVVLELWAMPDADLGQEIDLFNSLPADEEPDAWDIPTGVNVQAEADSEVLLFHEGSDKLRARRVVSGVSPGLYSLDVDVQESSDGAASVEMQCVGTSGEVLAQYSEPEEDDANESTPPRQIMRASVLCPNGTISLVIKLVSSGESSVVFRNPRLFTLELPSVSHLEALT